MKGATEGGRRGRGRRGRQGTGSSYCSHLLVIVFGERDIPPVMKNALEGRSKAAEGYYHFSNTSLQCIVIY